MSAPHPALIGFDQTAEQDFPLIMAVGREPSSHETAVHGLGTYDFRKSPNCAFWNTSYGTVGGAIGLRTYDLKALCEARRGSPLVYADALPAPILNAVANKAVLRAAVTDDAVAAHVGHIFSHEAIIRRVGLVFLSGLGDPVFKKSVSHFRAACAAWGISICEVPFFYGTNMPKIREKVTPEVTERIRAIMQEFTNGRPLAAV